MTLLQDLLDVIYTDGDITAAGNEGTIITGFHLAGQVILTPSKKQLEQYAAAAAAAAAAGNSVVAAALAGPSKGVFGELMRFTCCAHDYTTKITGGQTYIVENLYQESGVNYIEATGVPGSPPGTVAVSAVKTYTTTTTQTTLTDWAGLYWMSGGGTNFQPTTGPKAEAVYVTVSGTAATDLVYMLTQPDRNYPIDDALQFKISDKTATLTKIGNTNTNDTMFPGPVDDLWPAGAIANAVQGLDAIRRLGRIDLAVHYPELGVTDTCSV